MENNIDGMLLEFEEINSTIKKYLDDLESDNDEELVPRQNNQTTYHQESSLIAKTKKMHNNGIKPQPSILRESHFQSNRMGYTTLVQGQEFEHSKTPGISFLLAKIPTNILSFPTATPCRRLNKLNLHTN